MPASCARLLFVSALSCAIATALNGGANTWTENRLTTQSGPAWSVRAFALDPFDENVIYAVTDGSGSDGVRITAFWRTDDGGATWTQRRAPRLGLPYFNDVISLLISPTQPNTLYLLTQAAVHRTGDGGNSWTTKTLPQDYLRNVQMVIDPTAPDTIYVAQRGACAIFSCSSPGGGVYRSSDGGARWHLAGLGDRFLDNLFGDPVDAAVLYAIDSDNRLFQTRNRGSSWQNLTPDGIRVSMIAVDPIVSSTVYAVGRDPFDDRQIYKSLDSAQTWRPINPEQRADVHGIVIAPVHSTLLLAASDSAGVVRSVDGGVTWTPIDDGLEGRRAGSFAIAPSETIFYAIAGTADGPRLFDFSPVPQRRRAIRR